MIRHPTASCNQIVIRNGATGLFHSPITNQHSPTEILGFARKFLRQRVNPADQVLLARHAGDLIAHLAVLEDQESGDRANVEFEGEILILVDVHFTDFDGVAFFTRDLFDERRD